MDRSVNAGRRAAREQSRARDDAKGVVRKPHVLDRAQVVRDPADAPHLSVVLPAYNEEKRLGDTLRIVSEYLCRRFERSELIVVNDGSQDRTSAVVESFVRDQVSLRLIAYPANRGKGYAVRTGVLAAKGEMVLFSDADLSTPIEEVETLLAAVEKGADVAIGSRAAPGAQLLVRQPWYRELAGRSFNRLAQRLTPGIRDTQCGFKLFRREAAHEIFGRVKEDGFGFDAEVLHVAVRLGYPVAEVPVRWVHCPGSKVRLVRDSIRMFLTLLRVGRRHSALKVVRCESRRI